MTDTVTHGNLAPGATVISPSGALADAAATELGNRIRNADDMEKALDWALSVPGVTGAVVIIGETIGAKGNVELVPLGDPRTEIQDPKGD